MKICCPYSRLLYNLRITIVALLCITTLSGCFDTPERPMRLAVHPWIGYQSLNIKYQQYTLDPDLVEVVESDSLSTSSRMLAQAEVDAAALTLDEVLALIDKGVDLTVVLVFDASAGADLIIARPEVEDLFDLRGKVIGLEDSVLGRLMLSEALERGGLNQDQVQLRYGIVSGHHRLWENGELDALITYLPLSKSLQAQTHRLFDSHDIPNTILDVLAVRSEKMEAFEDSLLHLSEHHFRIATRLRRMSPDIQHRLATLVDMSVTDTAAVLREISFPGLEANRHLLQADSPQFNNTLQKLTRIMQSGGLLKRNADFTGVTTTTYLPIKPGD